MRARAAAGTLPGSVGKAAQARRRLMGRIGFLVVALLVVLLGSFSLSAAGPFAHHRAGDRSIRVQTVLPPFTWEPAALPYAVRGTDGVVYDFAFDPGLAAGDTFTARYDRYGRFTGTVVNDRFSRARTYPADPRVLAAPAAVWGLVTVAFLLLLAGARKRTADLVRDSREIPVSASATYEGSYVPKTLSIRATVVPAGFNITGFPVVVRDARSGRGRLLFLTAPLGQLSQVAAFEKNLAARRNRHVEISYYRRSGVLASLRDGDTVIEFDADTVPAQPVLPFSPK